MALTNQQIERYSRQIIVSGVGGIGQERLLNSRLMLAGSLAYIEPVLAYLVGAGVGAIHLQNAGREADERRALVARMRRLNSDVAIGHGAETLGNISLTLALIGDGEQLELARTVCALNAPIMFVRLDMPARIAVFPSRPPCPICADAGLFAPFARRGENAGFVAMAAATLALKTLASAEAIEGTARLIEFEGYRAAVGPLGVGLQRRSSCRCGRNS